MAPGEIYPVHCHGCWELVLIRQGAMKVKMAVGELQGVAGTVFCRPPGQLHEETVTSKVELKTAVVFWNARSMECDLPNAVFDTSGRVTQALSWFQELHAEPRTRPEYLDNLLRLILFECERNSRAPVNSRWALVLDHMTRRLADPITLDGLAETAGMSKNYFVDEFHRQVGVTPMAYLRKLRVDKANRMISETDTVLREVARLTGFRDEFELSRVFRRTLGYSPRHLRQCRRQVQAL